MARAIKIIFPVLILLAGLIAGYMQFRHHTITRGFRYLKNTKICRDKYEQQDYSQYLADRLIDYRIETRRTGISLCRDESELFEKAIAGELVEVYNETFFFIDKLRYSYPFVTGEADLLLREIGEDFQSAISETRLRETRIVLTSLTRTEESNKELIIHNPIASPDSPHLNGNAFDITYVRFKSHRLFLTSCDKEYMRKVLSEVIWRLRKENKCWATFEKTQHCFHVVAR